MSCNGQWVEGGWAPLGDTSLSEELGLRFTALASTCSGGWIYTGSGAGWSGGTVSLWDWGTGTRISTQAYTTGAANTVYPFSWATPMALTVGADYILTTNKVVGSSYAGNLDDALPPNDGFVNPVGWYYGTAAGSIPRTLLGARVGVFPQVCDALFCPYGTELQTPGQYIYYLTPGLIDLVLAATGEAWATPFLTAFWLTAVNAQTLCSTGPPPNPTLTIDDFVAPSSIQDDPDKLAKLWQWFQVRLWSYLCKCVPAPGGSPAPTAYPTPNQTEPTGVAPIVNVSCDGGDLCTLLNEISQAIGGMQQNLLSIRSQVDLIQRQRVPFAYIPGTLHSGLTGSGQFAVQGILGLAVQVTTVPGASGEEAGDPIARFGLGWVTTGTADGWRRSTAIRHNPQWVDVEPDDTLVGYSLEPLVVANIAEFIREH